jgi:NitT/TauT family transport system substrate-binding protein
MHAITLQEPFRALFYTPFYAALRRGAFAREGVEVRLVTVGDPDAAVANLLSGAADLAWSGPMRVIRDHARDAASPLRSFGAVVMRDPFLLVGRGPRPDGFALDNLRQLRLGTVSEVPTPWWCLQDDLRRAGIDPAALPVTAGRGMAKNAAALLDGGGLDLAQLFEPHAALAEARGGAVWHAQADRGPTSYTAFYATAAAIAAKRDAFSGMIRAMAATLAWLGSATPEAVAETIAGEFPDLPLPVIATSVARYQRLSIWAATPRFPREAFERLEGAMLGAGAIPRRPGFAACVEEDLVEAALRA